MIIETRGVDEAPDFDDEVDPLDAQNQGLHDVALDQGHEEVNLNLEGFDMPAPAEVAPDDASEADDAK